MKIVLVEDQTLALQFMFQLCHQLYPSAHIELFTAHDVALKSLDHSTDLLITDLDFDGDKRFALVELAFELKVPCIVYTGFYKPIFVRKALELQARGFISKMGKIEDLVFAIESFNTISAYTCSYVRNQLETNLKLDVQELILSPSEHKILAMLVQGMERKEIASKLKIQQTTLNSYIKDMKSKNNLGLAELVRNYVYWFSQ